MKTLLKKIVGTKNDFSLEKRVLIILQLIGVISFIQSAFFDMLVHKNYPVTIMSIVSAFVMAINFYLTRFKGYLRSTALISLFVAVFVAAPFIWIQSGGYNGTIPYWYIFIAGISAVVLRGKEKIFFVCFILFILCVLFSSQYQNIIPVYPYKTNFSRILDLLSQVLIVVVLLVALISQIINEYRSEHRKVEKYARRIIKKNKKLKELASTDSLSGLYTRRYILDKLKYEKNKIIRNKSCFSLLLCDIDNFKLINDSYGHECGDYIIVQSSKLIIEQLRKQDTVSRWGGEEFLILLPDTNLKNAKLVAKKILEKFIQYEFRYGNEILKVTLSFGVTCYDDLKSETLIHDYLNKADKAMYKSKKEGKNKITAIK